MLCLVRLINASIRKHSGCPYGSQSIGTDGYWKLYVVDYDNIGSHAGILRMGKEHGIDATQCYYIYLEMVPNSQINLGKLRQI